MIIDLSIWLCCMNRAHQNIGNQYVAKLQLEYITSKSNFNCHLSEYYFEVMIKKITLSKLYFCKLIFNLNYLCNNATPTQKNRAIMPHQHKRLLPGRVAASSHKNEMMVDQSRDAQHIKGFLLSTLITQDQSP